MSCHHAHLSKLKTNFFLGKNHCKKLMLFCFGRWIKGLLLKLGENKTFVFTTFKKIFVLRKRGEI